MLWRPPSSRPPRRALPPDAQRRGALGVDLGTSGVRLALVDPQGQLLQELAAPYPAAFSDPCSWRDGLIALCTGLSARQRQSVGAIALAGTSGTLLLCDPDGGLLSGELAAALPYHQACPEQLDALRQLLDPASASLPVASASGSLARALRLLASAPPGPWLLRHQADWLMGWLLHDWRWGEEGNNLRLGWDCHQGAWLGRIANQPWSAALPQIRPSGARIGCLAAPVAACLGLPADTAVVAGSTDANAAVLAVDPQPGEGVAVLGTTMVLKQFVPEPIEGPGLSCHRVAGQWLLGGASNAGGGVLRQLFSDQQLAELSRQIDPRQSTGLRLRPLPQVGERFPWDDPSLEPILEPRPVSDALYLQALLEGLAAIEQAGWQRLQQCGAPPVQRVLSLGGGARNPQWRLIRQRLLGVPVQNRPGATAAQGMAKLALRSLQQP